MRAHRGGGVGCRAVSQALRHLGRPADGLRCASLARRDEELLRAVSNRRGKAHRSEPQAHPRAVSGPHAGRCAQAAQALLGRRATDATPRANAPLRAQCRASARRSRHGSARGTCRRHRFSFTGEVPTCGSTGGRDGVSTKSRARICARFAEVTERHGRVKANRGCGVLGSAYRRSAVDHPGLRNPVERWKHGGGRAHRIERRRIEHPAALLSAWVHGFCGGVRRPEVRDFFRFGLYTGMRRGEVLALRWDQVALDEGRFVVHATKTGEPLELPVTRQLAALLARRAEARPEEAGGCSLRRQSPSSRSRARTATIAPSSVTAGNRSGTTRFETASSRLPPTSSSFPSRWSSASSTTARARRDTGLCERVDARAASRARSTDCGPDRRLDRPAERDRIRRALGAGRLVGGPRVRSRTLPRRPDARRTEPAEVLLLSAERAPPECGKVQLRVFDHPGAGAIAG